MSTSEKFEKRLARDGTHHERSVQHWQHQNRCAEAAIRNMGLRCKVLARASNAPAGAWLLAWPYVCLIKSVTKLFKPGVTKTPYKVCNGKQYNIAMLPPLGCYAVPHTKKQQSYCGKLADQPKPRVFVGYRYHLWFSSCLILDTKTRR